MTQFVLLSVVVLLGHLGWWVFCYNRINATALPRRFIKRCELGIILLILTIPVVMAATHWSVLTAMWHDQPLDAAAPVLSLWIIWSIGTVFILGPMWLESRLWLVPPKNLTHHESHCVNVADQVSEPLTGKWISHAARRLPMNEITHLSVTRKRLVLEREFPLSWQQLTIGHLSDLHFTGQLTPAFYHYVVERMQEMQPDMLVITGDIIDKDHCLDWIEPILGRLSAPLGRFFLFGNHECRLTSIAAAAQRMDAIGWTDLGRQDGSIDPETHDADPLHTVGRPKIILCGNENPWYERHEGDHWESGPLSAADSGDALKIGLSHTPDQHPWARSLGLDLLLAGHTHGGQVRIPGVGPLIAPSRHGSRFASGVFRLPPTLMHVSRGLAGTQPLRWRCPPEISLLTICPIAANVRTFSAACPS
ncbi:MAG: metallophosphoesterase [Pirellulaceae bacterium]|nr:metallophosphoesterase [Pirellulaceae bacterium]